MIELNTNVTVGRAVTDRLARSFVFERHGIDYCCKGKRTIGDAARDKGLDAEALIAELAAVGDADAASVDPAEMSLTELADHIEQTHHVYLREELPLLLELTDKVHGVHGDAHPWLRDVRNTYVALVNELEPHMEKEEKILFPMIRELEGEGARQFLRRGSVENPVRVMEAEHAAAGEALSRLRTLTSDFTAPTDACISFRALMDRLGALERDTHLHIHKENNVLFVRAAELEDRLNESLAMEESAN